MYEFIGYIAGTLIALTMIPQVILSIKNKEVEHISLTMLILFFSSMLLWFIYGILIKNYPLIVTNGFAATTSALQLFIKVFYSRPR